MRGKTFSTPSPRSARYLHMLWVEKRNFPPAIISGAFHERENELKETKTFARLSHFSCDFKQGFSYFAVLVCQGRRDEAFVARSRETLSELQSVEIDRV